MKAFHRAGLCVAGLVVLAGAACMIGPGRAVAQSDLEMPADPPVLSKPYRSTVPIFRRRPPPDAVPPEAGQPTSSWREPPGRIGARDAAAPDAPAASRDAPQESGFGPVKAAPARDLAPHDLAPEEEPDERPAAPARPGRAVPPPKPETRAEREPTPRETERAAREAEADEAETAPAYAGVWGPSTAACSSRRSARRGFLPAVIRPGSARAGKTLCQFRDVRREGRSWAMTASCHSAGRRWTSRVRLTVAGSRLTWASERGSATYTRCSGG
ncbi:hypothetical protein DK419_14120 [Methylobacterium terrae]|uniref:Peptidase inhibitor family I36 protein n=1 Tax=Methylobacterium terrae TaxID=2202827 RepID=A0A2U8WPC5_9HYPH|nr:hypothetical protein [Methylobacterium terrae]AWN47310.1 hypothetical protein DK419_14120 [Methylobacterium terrae]